MSFNLNFALAELKGAKLVLYGIIIRLKKKVRLIFQ